jgi:pimeloyl-ACP methyl ester carboxylesterase
LKSIVRKPSVRGGIAIGAVTAVIALLFAFVPASGSNASPRWYSEKTKPTIVLEHGAFADASGWNGVVDRLQQKGYTVLAPANPLRGIENDSAYLKAFLSTINGPVILVGHSYGGAVITNAATGNPNVKGLVYIAAFAPEKGETLLQTFGLGGHPEESLLATNTITTPIPGSTTDADAYINRDTFKQVFAGDLSWQQAKLMDAEQRPIAASALTTPSGDPAWKTISSYYMVAKNDKAIPPSAEYAMAARAHAQTVAVNSSHVAMISHPDEVTNLIRWSVSDYNDNK